MSRLLFNYLEARFLSPTIPGQFVTGTRVCGFTLEIKKTRIFQKNETLGPSLPSRMNDSTFLHHMASEAAPDDANGFNCVQLRPACSSLPLGLVPKTQASIKSTFEPSAGTQIRPVTLSFSPSVWKLEVNLRFSFERLAKKQLNFQLDRLSVRRPGPCQPKDPWIRILDSESAINQSTLPFP